MAFTLLSNASYNSNTDVLTLINGSNQWGQGLLSNLPQDNQFYTSFTLSNSSPAPFTYSFGDSNTIYKMTWNSNLSLSLNGSTVASVSNWLQAGSNLIEVKGRLGNLTVYNNASNVLQNSNADWSWGVGGFQGLTASNTTPSATVKVQGYQSTAIYTVLDLTEFAGDVLFDGQVYASNLIAPQYATLSNLSSNAAGWNLVGSNVYTFSNVSIGKSNASYTLDVSAGSVGASNLRITTGGTSASRPLVISGKQTQGGISVLNTVTGDARYHLFNQGGVTEWLFGQKSTARNDFSFTSLVGGSETDVLSILSSGKVGVGNIVPAYTLDVAGTTRTSNLVVTSNVAIGKSNASYALDVNGTVNATAFNGTVPWANITGAPSLTPSNASDGSTTGFNLGSTLLSGIVSGFAGAAGEYALQVGSQKLIDIFGNIGSDFITQMRAQCSADFTSGVYSRFQAGNTSVIIDGSNNRVFAGQSASNLGCTLGQNYLAASNGPLLLQTVTGSNVSTAVTLTSSNASFSGAISACNITEGGTALGVKYALSNSGVSFSNYVTPIAVYGSNTIASFSNYVTPIATAALPTTTYTTFSNAISPQATWTSNMMSNLASTVGLATFSNYVSPIAVYSSNTLASFSNYITPLVTSSNSSTGWYTTAGSQVYTPCNVYAQSNLYVYNDITAFGTDSNVIGGLLVGSLGYTSQYAGISHAAMSNQAGKYALLQENSGDVFVNAPASSTGIHFRIDNSEYALLNSSAFSINNLSVSTSATITNLTVSTSATINNLSVTGTASMGGSKFGGSNASYSAVYNAYSTWTSNVTSPTNVPLLGYHGALTNSATQSYTGTSIITTAQVCYVPAAGLYSVDIYLAAGSTSGWQTEFYTAGGSLVYDFAQDIVTGIPSPGTYMAAASNYYIYPYKYTSGTVTVTAGSYMRVTLLQAFG